MPNFKISSIVTNHLTTGPLESQVLMTIGAAPGTFPWWDKTRRVAGVLEGVFVLKMKGKWGPSTKTLVFQNTFDFKARTEESNILLV